MGPILGPRKIGKTSPVLESIRLSKRDVQVLRRDVGNVSRRTQKICGRLRISEILLRTDAYRGGLGAADREGLGVSFQ